MKYLQAVLSEIALNRTIEFNSKVDRNDEERSRHPCVPPLSFATDTCILGFRIVWYIDNRAPPSHFKRYQLRRYSSNMSHRRSTTSSLAVLRKKGVPLWQRHYATASKASVGGTSDPASYCSDFVKKYDPEAWLCHFFWPKDVRDLWLGWRAFNVSNYAASLSRFMLIQTAVQ